MDIVQPIHISLLEPVTALKEMYREYVINRVQTAKNTNGLPFNSWQFNYVPFMEALIGEMFNGSGNELKHIGTISHSTRILMENGVERNHANYIATEIFKATVNAIMPFLPNASFSNTEGYQYGICNDYDLMIMPPLVFADNE